MPAPSSTEACASLAEPQPLPRESLSNRGASRRFGGSPIRAAAAFALTWLVLLAAMPQTTAGTDETWSDEGGWSLACPFETDCHVEVVAPCCGFHTRFLHTMQPPLSEGMVGTFFFRGSTASTSTDAHFVMLFDSGWVNTEITGGPSNTRVEIFNSQGTRAAAGTWSSSSAWYQVITRVEPGAAGATVELRTESGTLLSISPRLALPAGATRLEYASLESARWGGAGVTYAFDDVDVRAPGAATAFLHETFDAPVVPPGDMDGDGVDDARDNCIDVPNADQANLDGDPLGDVCDPDDDGDAVDDVVDNCARVPNADQWDLDGDGLGDACDPDDDADGVLDGVDNCARLANADQANLDGDWFGDACDPDDDNDGLLDSDEARLGTDPRVVDTDGDGLSDGAEVHRHGTSPLLRDTDADWYGDGTEIECGSNPLNRFSSPITTRCTSALVPDEFALP